MNYYWFRLKRFVIVLLILLIGALSICGTDFLERKNINSKDILKDAVKRPFGFYIHLTYVSSISALAAYIVVYGAAIVHSAFGAVAISDFEAHCCDLAFIFIALPLVFQACGNLFLYSYFCSAGFVDDEYTVRFDLISLAHGPAGVLLILISAIVTSISYVFLTVLLQQVRKKFNFFSILRSVSQQN
jgi:hypothetical protein